MQAAIILSIYGDDRKLLMLKRLQTIESAASINTPTKTIIKITDSTKARVDLQLESTNLDDNSCIFKNTCNLQINKIMGQLGIKFILDARSNGWIVERYVDSIQDYFCLDYLGQPKSIKSMLAFNILTSILGLLGMIVPAATIFLFGQKVGLLMDYVLFVLILAALGSTSVFIPNFKRSEVP
jgi:hypothetical protein